MAVEYISYMQTENLIKAWPTIKGIRESLTIELNKLRAEGNHSEVDDYIYTKAIGNKAISDLPPSGKISDTTGDIAASYQQVMKNDYLSTLDHIREEKFYINLVDDKLEVAFRRLSPMQQQLLKKYYHENKTWTEVLEEMMKEKCFLSRQQAQRQRRDSITKVQSISKVTVDMYLRVMKLAEVE